MAISYWSFFGTIYLILLTWQDFRNNMKVDDRRNSFMLGMSISLISHVYTTILYKLALAIIIGILYYFMRKVKPLGEADLNSITWIFIGFGLINPVYLGFYAIAFIMMFVITVFVKNVIFRIEHPVPFYGVILTSFITVNALLRLYV